MRWLSVEEYYHRLGLDPIPVEEYERLLKSYGSAPAVETFRRRFERFRDVGDRESNEAFYRCYYGERMPGIDRPWSDVWACVFHRAMDVEILPELARFFWEPEPRLNILDAGCGDGLSVCYLALNFPAARFVGVDLRPEALALARERITRLGLQNVTLHQGDAFGDMGGVGGMFDSALLQNVVDDTREAGTALSAGRFDTVWKLRAVRRLVQRNARVWVSLTPYPHADPEFEARLREDFHAAGFSVFPAQEIPYSLQGTRFVHFVWTLCPRADGTAEVSDELHHRPEYVAAYHYPVGFAIPVEDAVFSESCYVNLSSEDACPQCSTPGAEVIYTGGPARTGVHRYKVMARVYSCRHPACRHGYLVAEVID